MPPGPGGRVPRGELRRGSGALARNLLAWFKKEVHKSLLGRNTSEPTPRENFVVIDTNSDSIARNTKANKQVRAALYGRVSTLGNGQDVGLQLDDLHHVAEQRGWNVVGVYVDEGVSGTVARRPQLDSLMEHALGGRFNLVAVWRFDRFARSTSHLLAALHEFSGLNIDFVSIRENIDTSTPVGRMVFTLMAGIAEFEAALIRERVQAGINRAKANGVKLGRPRVDMDVRPAIALFEQGHGLKSVAKMLAVDRATLRRRLAEQGEWPRA